MKVSQQKKAFVPVTITLETEEELRNFQNYINVADNCSLDDSSPDFGLSKAEASELGDDLVDGIRDIIDNQ